MFARGFSRIVTNNVARCGARRHMSGGHEHVQHPTTGIEGFVRKFLKEDHQLAMGVLGFYATIVLITKLMPSKKKEAITTSTETSTAASSGEIPSVDSPAFEAWISAPGNIEKLFA